MIISTLVIGLVLVYIGVAKIMNDISNKTCFIYVLFYIGVAVCGLGLMLDHAEDQPWTAVVLGLAIVIRELHDKRRTPVIKA